MSERIAVLVHFDKELLEWMDRYVLEKKQEDRGYSRNQLINEAMWLMKEHLKKNQD